MRVWCVKRFWMFLIVAGTAAAQPAEATRDSSIAATARADDRWLSKDKADHLTASAFLVGAQYYVLRGEMQQSHEHSLRLAIVGTLTAGIAKEIYDGVSKRGTPSFKDLAADALGIALAGFLLK